MGNWTLPYLITSIPWDAESAAFDQRVIETLVTLHRMRGDAVQAGASYWVVRKGRDSNTAKIGFVTHLLAEELMKGSALNHRIPADVVDMVKQIVG